MSQRTIKVNVLYINMQNVIQALKPGSLYLRIKFCLDMLEHFERQELTINSSLKKK